MRLVQIEDIFKNEGIDRTKPFVTVAFREWQDEKKYIKVMGKICDDIIKNHNMNILFIPMNPCDIHISKRIIASMENDAYLLKGNYNVYEIIEIIGKCSLVLGMRLHALIYAALNNIPMIGFAYNPKVDYYIKTLEMPLINNIFEIDENEVEAYINEILNNRNIYKNILSKKVEVLKKKAVKNIELLKEL